VWKNALRFVIRASQSLKRSMRGNMTCLKASLNRGGISMTGDPSIMEKLGRGGVNVVFERDIKRRPIFRGDRIAM